MAFIDDIKPLLHIFLRLVAIWVEIVVFALSYLTILGLIVFIPAGIILIYDIVLVSTRYKAKKSARALGQDYAFAPKVWIICLDFLFAVVFFGDWITHTWGLGENFWGWPLDAYTLVGELVIVHMHVFFASCELHLLRQRKNGAAAARRAEQKDLAKNGVELTTTPAPQEIPEASQRV